MNVDFLLSFFIHRITAQSLPTRRAEESLKFDIDFFLDGLEKRKRKDDVLVTSEINVCLPNLRSFPDMCFCNGIFLCFLSDSGFQVDVLERT